MEVGALVALGFFAVVGLPVSYGVGAMRDLLFDDAPLSDLVLSTFIARREALQRVQGIGLEVVGPRSSAATMQMLDFVRANRLPFSWHDDQPPDGGEAPLVRLPGGIELRHPSRGEVLRALGVGRELATREQVDLLVVGAGPAGLTAAVYGASEGLDTLMVESTALGGQAGSSRRIENYLGFPAGMSGTELTGRAVSERVPDESCGGVVPVARRVTASSVLQAPARMRSSPAVTSVPGRFTCQRESKCPCLRDASIIGRPGFLERRGRSAAGVQHSGSRAPSGRCVGRRRSRGSA